jgi:hypothetical protein
MAVFTIVGALGRLNLEASIMENKFRCLYVLYFMLVRSNLEYVSVVWNSITSAYANKLEPIQQKFASSCSCRFPSHVPYSYTFAFDKLSLHSLHIRSHHLDALFVCSSQPWP